MRLLPLALVACWIAFASASQPPAPAPSVGSNQKQEQPAARQADAQAAKPQPGTVTPTPKQPAGHEQTQRPKADAAPQQAQSPAYWWTGFDWPNWVMAVFTVAIFFLGLAQLWDFRESARTNATIERAYLNIQSQSPGLVWELHPTVDAYAVSVTLVLANRGNTPAEVTHTNFRLWWADEEWGQLPDDPPYEAQNIVATRAFVTKDADINVTRRMLVEPHDLGNEFKGGTRTLYLIGYVDYIDKFGQPHRAGYGRRYVAEQDKKNNFMSMKGIVDEKRWNERINVHFAEKPGYNYDRERKKGEDHKA